MTKEEKDKFDWIKEEDFNIISERIFRIFNKDKWLKLYGYNKLNDLLIYLISDFGVREERNGN